MNNATNARERLAKVIQNGAVLLHGNSVVYRNNDTWYPFRQDSNFHYLTAWPEQDAHAVIIIRDSKSELHLLYRIVTKKWKHGKEEDWDKKEH